MLSTTRTTVESASVVVSRSSRRVARAVSSMRKASSSAGIVSAERPGLHSGPRQIADPSA